MLKSNDKETSKKRSAVVLNDSSENDGEKRARTSAPTTPTQNPALLDLPPNAIPTTLPTLSPEQIATLKNLLVASMQDRINQLEDDIISLHETQIIQEQEIKQLKNEIAQLQQRLNLLEHNPRSLTSVSPQQPYSLSASVGSMSPIQVVTPRFFHAVTVTATQTDQIQTWERTEIKREQS